MKLLLLVLALACRAQIARDVALKFLLADADNDNLLSPAELDGYVLTPGAQHYSWSSFLRVVYPLNFWLKYDLDADRQISMVELNEIVKVRIKRHLSVWPSGSSNIINQLKTQDVLMLCDVDSSGELSSDEMFTCMRAFLLYEADQYPHRVRSRLYPNRTIGYSYDQFKALMPKSKDEQTSQPQLRALFQSFEWPQEKVPEDHDRLIGPEEGRFLEPTILYFYLDTDWDQLLSKQQFLRYFKNVGGEEAFRVADFTGDGALDQAELVAYYLFASCIDECPSREHSGTAWAARGEPKQAAIYDIVKDMHKIVASESEQPADESITPLSYEEL